ncbi:MAG: flavodoxin family protein [Candidatus Omnitrophica bacterium]|nr:flavodoxin family protein [Candidatus Omnitrophota bacterium]
MKVLVAYISWTGNTRKVAEAIYSQIQAEKEIKEFSQVTNLKGFDLVFVGFPIHAYGQVPSEAQKFLEEYCAGKKIALFVTHGAPEYSSLVPEWLAKCKLIAKNSTLLGIFNCTGQVADEQIKVMSQSSDPKAREIAKKVAVNSQGQPDAVRIEQAKAFAKEMVKKVA